MGLLHKIKFHSLKNLRMLWYHARYTFNKWKTIEGVDLPVYMKYGYSVLRFIDNGEYESGEIAIIRKTLDQNDRVLELGTGIGFVSAYCAKKIGSENVFSFEGNPDMKPLISELYSRNKVKPVSAITILGEKNGVHKFYSNADSFLASSATQTAEKGPVIDVPERNLNEVIAEIRPSYLVMDIEGGEYEIFKIIDFQSISKIQFELHPAILNEDQVNSIFEKLKLSGFKQDHSFKLPNNFYFTRNES